MDDPPPAAEPKPCCVCDAPGGKHCTKCKSRHYCSKACQLVDWNGGHKAACRHLAAKFQDRLLDELMPAKLKIKEEPPIVEDVSPAASSTAAARSPAARTTTTAVVKASAVDANAPDWRGTCAICLDLLPVEGVKQTFYECCCKRICKECSAKCDEYDGQRCPLCRSAPSVSEAERLRRVQKHSDKGNAHAQVLLGGAYRDGGLGLKRSFKRAFQWFDIAAAQGYAIGQNALACCYENGQGVKIDYKTALRWYRRAAEQGYPLAQFNLGQMLRQGKGGGASFDEAVQWYRLAAAQGDPQALYNLGMSYANGDGVSRDDHEALRLFKRAAAVEFPGAAAAVKKHEARLAEAAAAAKQADRAAAKARTGAAEIA